MTAEHPPAAGLADFPGHGAASAEPDAVRGALEAVRAEVGKAIVGQDSVLTGVVIGLLCRGHVLLEGVPGVAKTLLVRSLAAALALRSTRVQFTPDLMPGDITGSLIYDAKTALFQFREGPVFTNLLLADEINRTPPKTQAALLEAMEERQVSVEGTPRPLPEPFLVAATQNPIEYEGTYPLPEAQLDRFLVKLAVAAARRGTRRSASWPGTRPVSTRRPGRHRDQAGGRARPSWPRPRPRCATSGWPATWPGTSWTCAGPPGSPRPCGSACPPAGRPRCRRPAGPGPGWRAATTSPRTT